MIQNLIKNNFDIVWERIKGECGLKSLRELGEIIEKRQPTISAAKAKNEFPPGWAYQIGKKYGLLTEWIMTGEGPKRIQEIRTNRKFDILDEIESWLEVITKKEPYRKEWFQAEVEDKFPAFKAWKEEKEESEAAKAYTSNRKVA